MMLLARSIVAAALGLATLAAFAADAPIVAQARALEHGEGVAKNALEAARLYCVAAAPNAVCGSFGTSFRALPL